MSDNPLEIEIPAPGTIFEEHYIHPRNLELMNEEDDKARLLTRQEIRKLRKKQKEIQITLENGDYFENRKAYEQLREHYKQLKIELANTDYQRDILEVKARMRVIAQQGNNLSKEIEPLKKHAVHLLRIERRFNEHESALHFKKIEKRDKEQTRKEVRHFWNAIKTRYSQLKFREDVHFKDRHIRIYVKCQECYYTEDEIFYKLDVTRRTLFGSSISRLPDGVRVQDLTKEETLNELSAACERPVWSPHNEHNLNFDNGAWIAVSRLSMRGGIPEYIELSQVLAKYRQDDKHRFPLPFGIKRGRKINWAFMDEHPHFMINGQTFSGKSNAIVACCSTLVQMHTPDQIKLILVDLKRGGDLKPFESTPHCLMPVITETKHLEKVLARLQFLMFKRMEIIAQHTVDIQKYNALMGFENQMPRVLVVIDEYTAITMDPVSAVNVKQYSTILATQARASGIHLLIGNQQPYSKDLPSSVKGNITFHLTGRQVTMGASISTVGDGSATKIKKIPGRMVCNDGREIFDVQIPYTTPRDVENAVAIARNYPAPVHFELPVLTDSEAWDLLEASKPQELTEEKIITLALTEFEGDLKAKRLWEILGNEGFSYRDVQKVVRRITSKNEVDHQDITYETQRQPGNFYKLIEVEQIDSLTV